MKNLASSNEIFKALRERALTGLMMRYGMPTLQQTDIACVLTDFQVVASKIARSKSRSPLATIMKGSRKLRLTPLGRDLVDAAFKASSLLAVEGTVHVDPCIEALAVALRLRSLFNVSPHFYDNVPGYPHQCLDVLNGAAEEYRTLANSRAFWRTLARHKGEVEDRMRRLKNYFDLTAKRAPDSTVLRLELRIDYGGHVDVFSPAMMAGCHWRWIKAAEGLFDGGVAGQAFKIDFDPQDGAFVHVVLVVENAPLARMAAPLADLSDLWRMVTGHDRASILDCKAALTPLEYRAHTDKEWATDLRDELHNAEIYLAATDGLYSWDFMIDYAECAAVF